MSKVFDVIPKNCVRVALGVPHLEDGFGSIIHAMLISARVNKVDGQTKGNSNTPLPQLRRDRGQEGIHVAALVAAKPSFGRTMTKTLRHVFV